MPVSPIGELKKLTIYSYKDPGYSEEDTSFSVMFNPEQYTFKYEIDNDTAQGIGTSSSAPTFTKIKPQDLSLDFVLDGTAVTNGQKVDVATKTGDFLRVAYDYQGDKHKPRYLRVLWGVLSFKCVLKSASVKFTLFEPDGTPIRAKISATFYGFIEDKLRVRRDNSNSPDITHMQIVGEGDTLPLMSYKIYGDPKYYLQVAEKNGITNFRNIKPGDKIFFPPLSK